jgi:ankyrin repeat protein
MIALESPKPLVEFEEFCKILNWAVIHEKLPLAGTILETIIAKSKNTLNHSHLVPLISNLRNLKLGEYDWIRLMESLENNTLNINATNKAGESLLIIAIKNTQFNHAIELLKKGADVYIRDRNNFSVLHLTYDKEPELLELVLAQYPIQDRLSALQEADYSVRRRTIMHYAATSRSFLVILALLPKEDRLAAVLTMDSLDVAALFGTVNSPQLLKEALNLLPKQHHLAAVQTLSLNEQTLLYETASKHLDSFRVILEVLSEIDLLSAAQTPNADGTTLLEKLIKDINFRFKVFFGLPNHSLYIYCQSMDVINQFATQLNPQHGGFFSKKGLISQANDLQTTLNQCTSGEMLKEKLISFLKESNPNELHIHLLKSLLISESIMIEDYHLQLAALVQQWNGNNSNSLNAS